MKVFSLFTLLSAVPFLYIFSSAFASLGSAQPPAASRRCLSRISTSDSAFDNLRNLFCAFDAALGDRASMDEDFFEDLLRPQQMLTGDGSAFCVLRELPLRIVQEGRPRNRRSLRRIRSVIRSIAARRVFRRGIRIAENGDDGVIVFFVFFNDRFLQRQVDDVRPCDG